MPSLTVTIEDNSPIISYSSGWRAGHSSDDKLANMYSQSSFTVTNIADASASFTFNGTMVEIYGAKRANHGLFQVKLDDISYPPRTGSAPDPGIFQEPLFSVSNLALGLHTVTLINQEDKFLDIDFINWDTTIGTDTTSKLYSETFQDTSSSFVYLPSEDAWGATPNHLGSFLGGTGHATTQPGASFIYSFNEMPLHSANFSQAACDLSGEGISLYGPIGPSGSPYSVQVDGRPMSVFTTKKEFFAPQTLLYHASSLGPGAHNLTLTFQPDAPQQMFAIDHATIFTTTELLNGQDIISNTTAPNTTRVETDTRQMKSLAIGAMIGMAIAVITLLILSSVLLFLCRRNRARRRGPATDVEPYHSSPSLSSTQVPFLPPTLPPLQTTHLDRDNISRWLRYQPKGSASAIQSLSPGSTPSTSYSSPVVHLPFSPHNENPPLYTVNASASS